MNRSLIVIGIVIGITILGIGIGTQMQSDEIQIVEEISIKEDQEIKSNDEVSEIESIDDRLNEIERKAEKNIFTPKPRDWQTSGPFQIDRTEYYIGEKIFIVINDLKSHEKGQIAFLRPLNDTHHSVYQTIPFDGMKKPAFNYYTQANLTPILGTCSVEDIIGEWTVVFRGTDYPNLKFTIINEIMPGEEDAYVPVC